MRTVYIFFITFITLIYIYKDARFFLHYMPILAGKKSGNQNPKIFLTFFLTTQIFSYQLQAVACTKCRAQIPNRAVIKNPKKV